MTIPEPTYWTGYASDNTVDNQADPAEIIGAWDIVVCIPTDSAVGGKPLSGGIGGAWSFPQSEEFKEDNVKTRRLVRAFMWDPRASTKAADSLIWKSGEIVHEGSDESLWVTMGAMVMDELGQHNTIQADSEGGFGNLELDDVMREIVIISHCPVRDYGC